MNKDRQKLNQRIIVRVDDDAADSIHTLAKSLRISASDLIRAAVMEKVSDWAENGAHLKPTRKLRATA